MKDRCIHIYYGNGKGKTTAAVGQLLRSRGHGMGALLAGFLKDGSSGENRLLQEAGVTLLFAPDAAGFVFAMDAADKAAYLARQRELFLSLPARLAGLGGGIALFDEALDALSLGVFSQAELLSLLAAFPGEVILTGHICPPELLAAADYVTHMSAQKHPYTTRSLPGRAGIEW